MKMQHLLGVSGLALLMVAPAAWSGQGKTQGTGSLTLLLSDAPVDTVEQIWVQYRGIRLHPQQGKASTEILFDAPLDVNMLLLTGGNTELLLSSEAIPAGVYHSIELLVDAQIDTIYDSYVVTNTGAHVELEVPGSHRHGLRLLGPFTIEANAQSSFLIDWDMRQGLAEPRGRHGYLLRPAFRVVDVTAVDTSGSLRGSVATQLVNDIELCANDLVADTGNAVYVYDRFDRTRTLANDVGGAAPTPIATAPVKQNTAGDYTYEIVLEPKDYTVAFTCQGLKDDPDTDDSVWVRMATDVTVAGGDDVVVNFEW